ncbi:hypothetical protein CEXT_239931 [Caerostris extrusa]|uniref:Uncharacterized protein n=1 Tax=Caerostris extrusa TaxID=172846 RepID=A0AAV4XJE5_CAEEX|nr:hypothetical protein CEXT_239931 [Caerostris extrusa]
MSHSRYRTGSHDQAAGGSREPGLAEPGPVMEERGPASPGAESGAGSWQYNGRNLGVEHWGWIKIRRLMKTKKATPTLAQEFEFNLLLGKLLLSVTANQTHFSLFPLIQNFEFRYSNIFCSPEPFLDFHILKRKQTSFLSCKYRLCKGTFLPGTFSMVLFFQYVPRNEFRQHDGTSPEEREHTSVCRAGYRFCGI